MKTYDDLEQIPAYVTCELKEFACGHCGDGCSRCGYSGSVWLWVEKEEGDEE